MIILPVGVDDNVVRRTPWVTFVVIGLCTLIQLILAVGGNPQEVEERMGEAVRYLAQHPYLSAPPALESVLSSGFLEELERVREEVREDAVALPADALTKEQLRLDELSAAAMEALHSRAVYRFGFVPAEPQLLGLIAHMFLHGGWLHLIGNMLFLFLSGPYIEDLYGRPLFAGFYLVSGLVAAGAHATASAGSVVPLVGASGAIAGVMGAFLWRLSARRIHLLVIPLPIIPRFRFNLKLPAYVVLPVWATEQVVYAVLDNEGAGVAFAAHVGGFAVGLVLAMGVQFLRIEERLVTPAIEQEISLQQNPGIERATDARAAGDLALARREIAQVLQAEPQNVDAWTESWETALAGEDGEAAGRAGLRLIELHRRAGERDLASAVVNDRRWRELKMPARFLLTAADMMAREGDGRSAIEIYQRSAAELPPDDPAVLRALVAEGTALARGGDERRAKEAFERAKAHPAYSDMWRERIEIAQRAVSNSRRG